MYKRKVPFQTVENINIEIRIKPLQFRSPKGSAWKISEERKYSTHHPQRQHKDHLKLI